MYEVKVGGSVKGSYETFEEAIDVLCDLRVRLCRAYSPDEFEIFFKKVVDNQ